MVLSYGHTLYDVGSSRHRTLHTIVLKRCGNDAGGLQPPRALGLETAQQLVFVQTNDPMTRKERDFDVCVE